MFDVAFLSLGMQTLWPMSKCFIALVTGFHTIFRTCFVPLAFHKSSSAQSDSLPAWRLTFPLKEPHCCSLIPLRPPLHKTMVSIASTEYIHSSDWETGWMGPEASLPVIRLDSQSTSSFPLIRLALPLILSLEHESGTGLLLCCSIVKTHIMFCVCIYFPMKTVDQTHTSPTFLMNGLHSISFIFPSTLPLTWQMICSLTKTVILSTLSLEIGSTHPPLQSISPFVSVPLFFLLLSLSRHRGTRC